MTLLRLSFYYINCMKSKMKKLNIGSGANWRLYPDYDGLDIIDYGQKWVGDVLKLLPKFFHKDGFVDENSSDLYDEVMANHFLEHFNQDELKFIFYTVNKILKKGGIFRFVVPHKKRERAWILSHKTFWNEETVKFLETKDAREIYGFRNWKIKELVTNSKGDIHCQLEAL